MRAEIYQKMYETESYHWWFQGKKDIITMFVKQNILTKTGGGGVILNIIILHLDFL